MAQGVLGVPQEPEISLESRDRVINEYRSRGARFRRNFETMVKEGAYDKASECLWGWFSAYTNALAILRSGNPIRGHFETEEFAKRLCIEFGGDREALMAISDARNMHRNFYHGGPISEVDFELPLRHITRYLELVDSHIRDESVQGVGPSATMPLKRRRRSEHHR